MMEVEENLKSTIMWKYSQKKSNVDIDTKIKDDYLIRKFHEIVKCHNKICFFFLFHSLATSPSSSSYFIFIFFIFFP